MLPTQLSDPVSRVITAEAGYGKSWLCRQSIEGLTPDSNHLCAHITMRSGETDFIGSLRRALAKATWHYVQHFPAAINWQLKESKYALPMLKWWLELHHGERAANLGMLLDHVASEHEDCRQQLTDFATLQSIPYTLSTLPVEDAPHDEDCVAIDHLLKLIKAQHIDIFVDFDGDWRPDLTGLTKTQLERWLHWIFEKHLDDRIHSKLFMRPAIQATLLSSHRIHSRAHPFGLQHTPLQWDLDALLDVAQVRLTEVLGKPIDIRTVIGPQRLKLLQLSAMPAPNKPPHNFLHFHPQEWLAIADRLAAVIRAQGESLIEAQTWLQILRDYCAENHHIWLEGDHVLAGPTRVSLKRLGAAGDLLEELFKQHEPLQARALLSLVQSRWRVPSDAQDAANRIQKNAGVLRKKIEPLADYQDQLRKLEQVSFDPMDWCIFVKNTRLEGYWLDSRAV